MKTQKTLTQIQEEYIETVNAARERWNHRKDGGHSGRTRSAAYRRAAKQLRKWEFNDVQIRQIIRDAQEVADLNYRADHAEQYDDLNHASEVA